MKTVKTVEMKKAKDIVAKYHGERSSLIAILQDVQEAYRYLPKEVLVYISMEMYIPLTKVYEVATFYNAFSFKPRGRYLIELCAGTACHVKGGFNLLGKLERDLNIACGETTEDGAFTLEQVRCLGCCSLAPVVRIDDNVHAYLTQDKIPGILRNYRKQGRKSA